MNKRKFNCTDAALWLRGTHRTLVTGLITVFGITIVLTSCSDFSAGSSTHGLKEMDRGEFRAIENSRPAWGKGEGWRVDQEDVVRVSANESSSEVHLVWVADAERLEDGRILVADGGRKQLLLFDEAGRFIRSVGRAGEGPGEFTRIGSIFRCAGDTLFVEDNDRLNVFDRNVTFVRSQRIVPELQRRPWGVQGVRSDCSEVLLRDMDTGVEPTPGEHYDYPQTLFWARFADGVRDTVVTYRGFELTMMDGVSDITVPFGTFPVWTAADSDVYLATSEKFEIYVFRSSDESGDEVLRWRREPEPVGPADRRAYAEFRSEILEEEPYIEHRIRPLEDFRVPKYKPAYFDLLVDDEGNLWAQEYPERLGGYLTNDAIEFGDPPDVWHIYDPEGRLLGLIEMPAHFELHAVRGGFMIGVAVDELDVERVELYPIRKDDGP